MIVTPLGCAGACELGLENCEGRWVPQYCVLQRRDDEYKSLLRKMAAAGRTRAGDPPAIPYNRDADIDSPRWHEYAARADACEFRKAIADSGCCGPRHKCVGGRHNAEVAEPISYCVGCMRAWDAAGNP
jgi:hypothetical protein